MVSWISNYFLYYFLALGVIGSKVSPTFLFLFIKGGFLGSFYIT